MKQTGLRIPGYRLDKQGKLVKAPKYASVSQRLKSKGSKKVRVARKGTV